MRKLLNEELDRLSVSRFRESEKTPIIVVLDNIRSLNNVGAVFRTADAYRIEKIYLCGITAQPPHKDIRKTALGATETVTWEYRENTFELIKELNESGIHTCAIEQAERSVTLHDFKPSATKLAVVMGNEVKGVQQEVVDLCTHVIELQQYGTKHSLNIAVCTGIVLYDFYYKMV